MFCRHCGASIPHRYGEGRCQHCAHHETDINGKLITSAVIGAVTGSALIGGLLGGSLLGGLLGDSIEGDD